MVTKASQIVSELRITTDAVWRRLSAQLQGMECHMERSNGPAEWTTRQVLSHLLGAPGWRPVPILSTFAKGAPADLPVIEIRPGQTHLTPERQMMKLQQFKNALDRHRRETFEYLETLDDEDLRRKARIPLFQPLLGTDEVTVPTWVNAYFVVHWSDHAGQLAKIRKTVGLAETTEAAVAT
ncbi:MAG: hypothetical protein ACREKG_04690 [Candidatus Rokuibacteriota bacterium]